VSALLAQHQDPSEFLGVLAVGQAATVGQDPLPGVTAELSQIKQQARALRVTQLDDTKATASAVLAEIEAHSWVHLACHATQNTVEPTKSTFHLHNSSLNLATIMSKSLNCGGVAYLSACQTATGDENLPEEAVHLAAGMLMAGYSTVIATMWSISDLDAPLIARIVYAGLMEGGIADSRRAAKALHVATAHLRSEIGEKEFTRWIPYIHIGI
jgi:CHAT domain-containing protein